MTTMDTMTAARFKLLLEAYGAEIGRWPEAERLAAHAYAETAPEAAALLAEARHVDALLAALPSPQLPGGLEQKILAGAGMTAQRAWHPGAALRRLLEALWPETSFWKPASVLASALVLGGLIGVNLLGTLVQSDTDAAHEDLLAYAVTDLTQDLN